MATGRKQSHAELLIAAAINRHGGRYDYSETQYTSSAAKVVIICPLHGKFLQTLHSHIRGHGCLKCGTLRANTSLRSDTVGFISQARQIHGDRYDYSETQYGGSRIKVSISCPVHGSFWQRPDSHLKGRGCLRCTHGFLRSSKERFVAKAQRVHGDRYDYSKVKYDGWDRVVEIVCPTHGSFWQKPHNHFAGHGCERCASWRNQSTIAEHRDSVIRLYNDGASLRAIADSLGVGHASVMRLLGPVPRRKTFEPSSARPTFGRIQREITNLLPQGLCNHAILMALKRMGLKSTEDSVGAFRSILCQPAGTPECPCQLCQLNRYKKWAYALLDSISG